MTLFDQNDQDTIDPNKDYFTELVGEGKKYADEKALARSRLEADRHIKKLEREQAELRADYLRTREEMNAVPKLQELLDQLAEKQLTSSDTTHNANEDNNKPAIDMKEIESLFSNKLKEHETSREQERNYNESLSKLKTAYGENFQSRLQSTMNEMNLTEDFVNNLARTNPTAFARLFVSQPQGENFQAPPQSNRRSDSFAPATQKRDWAYYENLRTTKPDVYWRPQTQNQMHADAEQLGDAFH